MTALPDHPDTTALLGWRGHAVGLLALGVPLILSNVAQYSIHLTDVILLGWYDVNALAGVTLATSLYFVMYLLGAGFAWAVTPLVAAAAEAGDQMQVRRVTRMALWLSAAFGLIVSAPMMWSEQAFLAIGQDPLVAALAQDYLNIAAWGLIPALMSTVIRAFLSAMERTAIILIATIGSAVINGIVGYALIFGTWGMPEMGIQGAAWAALASLSLSGLIMLGYALRRFPDYRLLQRLWKVDPAAMRRVFRLGAPIGLTSLAEGGLFSASAFMVGTIGAIPLAAHGIALQLASATFMFHMGISQATTVRAGRALGRGDEANLRRGGLTAIGMSVGFSTLTVVLFLAFPTQLISVFIDRAEPAREALMATGVALLAVAALFQLVDGLQVVALGLLRGVQDTTMPMILATISYWCVGLPISAMLGFWLGFGAVGIWLGLVAGLAAACGLLMGRFWGRSVRIGTARFDGVLHV